MGVESSLGRWGGGTKDDGGVERESADDVADESGSTDSANEDDEEAGVAVFTGASGRAEPEELDRVFWSELYRLGDARP